MFDCLLKLLACLLACCLRSPIGERGRRRFGRAKCSREIRRRIVTCQWKGRSAFSSLSNGDPCPCPTKQSSHTKHTPGSQLKVEDCSVKGEREEGGGGPVIRVRTNSGNSVQSY